MEYRSAYAVVATDSASANVDCDNGTAIHDTRRSRRDRERATHCLDTAQGERPVPTPDARYPVERIFMHAPHMLCLDLDLHGISKLGFPLLGH